MWVMEELLCIFVIYDVSDVLEIRMLNERFMVWFFRREIEGLDGYLCELFVVGEFESWCVVGVLFCILELDFRLIFSLVI